MKNKGWGWYDLRKYCLCHFVVVGITYLIIPFSVPRMSGGVTPGVPKSLSINVSPDVSQPSHSGNGRAISYDEKPQDYIKYLRHCSR